FACANKGSGSIAVTEAANPKMRTLRRFIGVAARNLKRQSHASYDMSFGLMRRCDAVVGHRYCAVAFTTATRRRERDYHEPSGFIRSSRKCLNTEATGLGAACPRPQIEASRISTESSLSRSSFHGPVAISLTAFSVPTRQGVH